MPDTDWCENKAIEEGRLSALDGGRGEMVFPTKATSKSPPTTEAPEAPQITQRMGSRKFRC